MKKTISILGGGSMVLASALADMGSTAGVGMMSGGMMGSWGLNFWWLFYFALLSFIFSAVFWLVRQWVVKEKKRK